ncbi:hypothetical protein B0H34DRAFT_727222 [Crassisporium funariophilum]|nr:hypothetical protein B0H34DRAFT_727222 [Crassisporium funariophilum]
MLSVWCLIIPQGVRVWALALAASRCRLGMGRGKIVAAVRARRTGIAWTRRRIWTRLPRRRGRRRSVWVGGSRMGPLR